jgi:RNA exonuclease 1
MLAFLPPGDAFHRRGVHKLPAINTYKQNDAKRKYTETFNLAANEFVPAKTSAGTIPAPAPLPIIDPAVHPSINPNVRLVPLGVIYETYKELYKSLPDFMNLAARDAAQEEFYIAKSSPNAQTYKVSWRQYLARLKKRDVVIFIEDACTLFELERRKLELDRLTRWNEPQRWTELQHLIPSKEELSRWGYITSSPKPEPFNPDKMVSCHRCTTIFTPQTRTQYPCISHWGKQIGSSTSGERPNSSDGKTWSCCQKPVGTRGCTTHPCHVRKVSAAGELASIRPFTELDKFVEEQHHSVVSLDCEMVYTLNGTELVRLTVLDASNRLLLDCLVRPETEITDYNTRFSGITKEMFESASTVSFDEALELLKLFVSRTTVIIGHGLENDLVALRLIHHRCIDTALLYPHPRGRPYRLGLKHLMRRETGMDIQTAGEKGHSSHEDAAAAAILVRKRIRGDAFPGFGKVELVPAPEKDEGRIPL